MSARVGPSSYFDLDRIGDLPDATADLVRRRAAAMGPAYRLFYREPLEPVRGEGVLLYDIDGRDYLDCYNNVPSIGHSHPRLAAAVAEQLATLATHTRYLSAPTVAYAEDLLSTMPPEIGHLVYTCTGSEAGDLALRVAKHQTGRRGVIVTRNAYHGVTTEVAACSPSLDGLDSLPDWVRVVPAPDAYRVDTDDLGGWFAARVQEAVDDLAAAGHGTAALLVDSILASDGVLPDPAGFLAPAVEVVRRGGGLYVADEVQPGFGRTGEAMWGFQRHGLVPDIVTMGKPMGGGFPVAATAFRPEILQTFGREIRYFNTFGGNPVAVRAAQTVLDVIREEDLRGNAARTGAYLLDGLRELAARHLAVGDVRGAGLFVAVELVTGDGTPDEALALEVVNDLRERRVLLGTAGIDNNILKIRPPLPFAPSHADRLLTELDASLGATA